MIYSPSWLQVDAIPVEYYAPTPPTYTPPAEVALSQAACVCLDQEAAFKEEKSMARQEIAVKCWQFPCML